MVRYSAAVAPEIAGDVGSIDASMKLGYGWREGPFALADKVGIDVLRAEIEARGITLPPLLAGTNAPFYARSGSAMSTDGRPDAVQPVLSLLAQAKAAGKPILGNEAAALWNIGDGVACFEITTKLNSFVPAVFDVLEETIRRGNADFQALVLGNDDARAFSAGADLSYFASGVRDQRWA